MGDRIEFVQNPRPNREAVGTTFLSVTLFGGLAFQVGHLDNLSGMVLLTILSMALGGLVWFGLQGERK